VIRVLLIDDHAAVRRAVGDVLRDVLPGGALVGEAVEGDEALALLEQAPWDVVLLDLSLPGRGGVEVLRDIKRARPHLPVLVLSMHAEAAFAPHLRAAGAAGYLAKGSPPAAIADTVTRALREASQ
jgi:two-component system, NarL family, invasion response regulator UvrY